MESKYNFFPVWDFFGCKCFFYMVFKFATFLSFFGLAVKAFYRETLIKIDEFLCFYYFITFSFDFYFVCGYILINVLSKKVF